MAEKINSSSLGQEMAAQTAQLKGSAESVKVV